MAPATLRLDHLYGFLCCGKVDVRAQYAATAPGQFQGKCPANAATGACYYSAGVVTDLLSRHGYALFIGGGHYDQCLLDRPIA